MDLLIEKNDGSKAFISQFKVLVTEFEESAPVVKRNNTELDQRNGAIDFGGWHDSKEIKLTAIYKADGMDDEERLREKIYALLSDPDGYYITQFKTSPLETLQRPGETTGDYFEQLTDYPSHKRFNVYASEIENEFQGRIGDELLYKLAVTFKTLWLPYGETPARDVALNENKANAAGVNLLTDTSSDLIVDDSSNTSGGFKYATVYSNLVAGTICTFSSDVSVVGTAASIDVRVFNPTTGKTINDSYTTFSIVNGKISGLVKPIDGYTDLLVYAGNSGNTHGNKVTFHHMKLEQGSVATDWCPNPADTNYNSWLYDINSVAIKYIGTVPCNQLEQGFKIRFTATQEADHLDLSMNGETVTYSDTVYSGDVFEFAGFSYKLNELSVTNKVTKNYYTLKPNGENILSCNITGKFEILKFQNLYA